MAKVTVAGNSFIVTSDLTMEDLETVKKYRPKALALTDPETKEELFKVGIGASSANDYGISFGGVSNDEEKLATATLPIPSGTEDAKTYVLDKAGLALAQLNKVEESILSALDDIRDEREKIAGNITVII